MKIKKNSFFQKKRASTESWMVYTGIILVTLVIFGIFIKDWNTAMSKEQRIQTCKRSVEFRGIGDQIDFIEEQLENPSSELNKAIKIGVIVVVGVVIIVATAGVAGIAAAGVGSGLAGGSIAGGASAATSAIVAGGSTSIFAGATAGATFAGATGLSGILTAAGATAATVGTQAVVAGAVGYGVSEVFVPTADEILKGNAEDVELNCFTESKKITSNKKEIAYKEIANEMYICYDMFGKGKYDNIFGPNGMNYCFTCSIISFKNKDLTLNRAELSYYLITHSPQGSDLRYSDIFAGCSYLGCSYEGIEIEEPEEFHSDFDFKTNQDFAILYLASDFDSGNSASVVFIPYNFQEIRYFCNYVYMGKE